MRLINNNTKLTSGEGRKKTSGDAFFELPIIMRKRNFARGGK